MTYDASSGPSPALTMRGHAQRAISPLSPNTVHGTHESALRASSALACDDTMYTTSTSCLIQVSAATVVLAPYSQCGGINNAPSAAESGDHPWNSTECSQDFQCLTNANPWFYQVKLAHMLLCLYSVCAKPKSLKCTLPSVSRLFAHHNQAGSL